MAASRHECTICMDSFKNPKLISCHHSFCYKCLEDYVQVNLHNGRFNCPICMESVKLSKKGISGFQSNFYIETEKNENLHCEICGPKNMACRRCLDCEENLCQSCCYVHEKSKASRHHKISDLVTPKSEIKDKKIRQLFFCDQHPVEEIKLFCQYCKVPICLMCKAIEHDTRPTKPFADVVAKLKITLDTKLDECSEKLRRIKASTVKGEELDRSINDAEQEELKAVDCQCSQLHKAIDQEAASFKDKIKHVYCLLKEQNAVSRSYMQEEFKSYSNTKEIAKNLRDKGTDIEIIEKGPDIEQLISAAIVNTDPTPTVRLKNKLFSPAKILSSKLIPLIGILNDNTNAEKSEKKKRKAKFRRKYAVHLRFRREQDQLPSSKSNGASGDGVQEQSISSTKVCCNLSTDMLTIKDRVKQIVKGKINGMWATRLPYEYKEMFGEEAPGDLMFLVKNSFKDICKVELAQQTERELIYPVLEDHDKCKDLRILQQELLPIGEKITVYVTCIYNRGYFCVQKEDSCIDQIAEELQKDCKTNSAPNMELLKIGQFCAGLFSTDKCWTRAKVIDIKDSEPKIELLFVDYGNVERVLSKDIRWLSEKAAAVPAQCIKCSLHGIQLVFLACSV